MVETRKLVFIALLVTLGTTLHALEAMLPNPLPFPGAKLGLANIVTLLALSRYGLRAGLTVAVLRVLFGSLVGGTLFSAGFMMSMSGSVVSAIVMAFLGQYVRTLSIIGVSMAGSVSHNLAQVLTASLLIQTKSILFYLPVLIVLGLPTGFLTGYISRILFPYLKRL